MQTVGLLCCGGELYSGLCIADQQHGCLILVNAQRMFNTFCWYSVCPISVKSSVISYKDYLQTPKQDLAD